MGDTHVEFKPGLWRRYRFAAYTCLEIVAVVLIVAFEGLRSPLNAVIFVAVVVVAAVVTYVFWRLSERPVTVRLSSAGVEQHVTGRRSTCTPWHDIEAIGIATWTLKDTDVQCPVLILRNGQKTRINAILTTARPISPVIALFRSLPRDPRFQDKVAQMRRLLAQSRDLQWPGATRPV